MKFKMPPVFSQENTKICCVSFGNRQSDFNLNATACLRNQWFVKGLKFSRFGKKVNVELSDPILMMNNGPLYKV